MRVVALLLVLLSPSVPGSNRGLPALVNALGGTDDWFQLLDLNHDGLLDKSEYNVGLGRLRGFLKQPLTPDGVASAEAAGASASSSSSGWTALPRRFWDALWNVRGFWNAFTSAVAMILATEIGDKTFFIAAVLSMQHDRWAVLAGALAALYLMTVLSTFLGVLLPSVLPKEYTHIIGGLLFLYFGLKLYWDSRALQDGKTSDELEEVEEELLQKKDEDGDEEAQQQQQQKQQQQRLRRSNSSGSHLRKQWYQVTAQSFTLTFLAEWGDRSQIASIALGAHKNPLGVTVGGCLGHTLCTGVAVVGGRMLAARISEKTVHRWGGIIFLLFGIHSLFFEQ